MSEDTEEVNLMLRGPKARTVGRVDPRALAYTTLSGAVEELPESAGRLRLQDARLSGVDFSGHNLDALSLVGHTILKGCDFSRASLGDISWSSGEPTLVSECTFDSTSFPSEMMLGPVRFERCHFDSRLEKMFSFAGEFVECQFGGTLMECTFFGRPSARWQKHLASRKFNEYQGNDFRTASIRGTAFRDGVPLHAQQFPSNLIVVDDVVNALARLEQVIEGLDDESLRRRLRAIVARCRLFYDAGQKELLINPDDFPLMTEDLRADIIAVLV